MRFHQLLPHNAHGQDEQAVRNELMRDHQHDADNLGGTAREDGEGVACRSQPAVQQVTHTVFQLQYVACLGKGAVQHKAWLGMHCTSNSSALGAGPSQIPPDLKVRSKAMHRRLPVWSGTPAPSCPQRCCVKLLHHSRCSEQQTLVAPHGTCRGTTLVHARRTRMHVKLPVTGSNKAQCTHHTLRLPQGMLYHQ